MALTAVILTFNESAHIERCMKSLAGIVDRICICDSYSTDDTVELVRRMGGEIRQNTWTNHAVQFNWALENFNITTAWVMRLDADEYLTPELGKEIRCRLKDVSENISHLYVKRRVHFMNRWIRHGDYYPVWLLRIWRDPQARCESRWMDEHIKVTVGDGLKLENDIVDENLNDLTWWVSKHNHYATREAADLLNAIYQFKSGNTVVPMLLGTQEQRKRWLKVRYASMPLFLRPFLYYFYRYIFRLGVLDGQQGLIWHFLQGFWYRFLVDAKIYEVYNRVGRDREDVEKYLRQEWGIDFDG